jgi:hypothetical protein
MAGNNYYVYQYINEDGTPYYIGKGSKSRIREKHNHTIVPPIEQRIIIKSGLSNEEAKQLEGELITKYGRKLDGGILDNIKINQWACFDGWKHKPETIEKIRQGNLGKIRTEEHKQKYRQPKTESHANNIKNAVKQLWADPEYRAMRKAKTMETRRRNGFSV